VHNILLVEDSLDAFNLVKRALGSSAQLEWAKSLGEASRILQKKIFDLILLDVMLPDGDGYRLCSILQTDDQLKNVPVIFLTAKNSVSDKVLGFSVGAEDFISKPFDGLELKARVDSRLRKRDREKVESDILKFGDLEINKSTQRVQIYENGQTVQVDLTPIEFKLLLFLSKELGKVYSRDEILNSVWGESIHVYSRSVDTHISKLRKKLGTKADYVESVHGSGYRFNVDEATRSPRVEFVPQHPLL
jgi:two-component system phosphate regulon response regulator PhoB